MNKHRIWENGTVRAINSNTRKVNRLFLKQQSRKQCLRVVIVERASSNGKSIFLKNRLAVSDWCRIYFVGMGDFWWRCLFRFCQGRKISSWRSYRLNHSKKLFILWFPGLLRWLQGRFEACSWLQDEEVQGAMGFLSGKCTRNQVLSHLRLLRS